MPKYDFSDSVAVVTGGARGQGLSHAIEFAKSGADVVILDRGRELLDGIPYKLSSRSDLKNAAKLLREFGTRSEVLAVDVTSQRAIENAFSLISKKFGRVDVLVNNAGVNAIGNIDSVTREVWDGILNANLLGTFLCCKYAVRAMRRGGGGRIVNVSSVTAIIGMPNLAPYSASKAGLLGLTRALAIELGPDAITVNAVCPTVVDSPMTSGLNEAYSISGSSKKKSNKSSHVLPSFHALRPEDVTSSVMWLASDAARYITGQVIAIDAGLSVN